MNASATIFLAAAVIAGLALSIQAPINGQLGRAVHSTLLASTISFSVSVVLLLAISYATGEFRQLSDMGPTPWWLWIGGIFGPIYMLGIIYSVPNIGVVSALAAVVAGQLLGAMTIDLIGAFGVAARPISLTRVLSVCFVFAGVVLSRY
ncbi:MAG: EamA-like transporter family protein [Cereibacter sphaeroides]|uniref:EamA-like transporter family protein n=1 Tax=Cereibacter sphaeroides TaxID=1063 RepID=A0A2W5S420_CERSP|nr:MAG: EamA-like transporter family protein [Cereibacter sphaeroides]